MRNTTNDHDHTNDFSEFNKTHLHSKCWTGFIFVIKCFVPCEKAQEFAPLNKI